jgi:heme-degrading monooxygenase HmoA
MERENDMAIKVFIKRKMDKAKEVELEPLLMQLRALAINQSGYIKGETLRNIRHPSEYLVISTWESMEDWDAWFSSDQRTEISERIDDLLQQETVYDFYHYG